MNVDLYENVFEIQFEIQFSANKFNIISKRMIQHNRNPNIWGNRACSFFYERDKIVFNTQVNVGLNLNKLIHC